MRRAMGLIAAGGIIVLLTTACGDDRPSRGALTEKVAEICEAAGERHELAMSGFDFDAFDPETSDLTRIIPLIEQNVAIGQETAHELDKVRGPEPDEEAIDSWIDVNDRIADNAEEMITAARDGDREQFMSAGAVEEELHAELPDDAMFEGC